MSAGKSEQELAERVVAWLEEQHWDVYQEVQPYRSGHIADIMAVRAGYLWVIECKTSFGFVVLEQANGWRVHYRSVAVSMLKSQTRSRPGIGAAEHYYKVGVIEVGPRGVRETINAPLQRHFHRNAKEYIRKLKPEHKKFAQAGSANGGHYTPYNATIANVRAYIDRNPGCTLKEIIDHLGKMHYASDRSAMGSLKMALARWESGWCRTEWVEGTPHYYIKA